MNIQFHKIIKKSMLLELQMHPCMLCIGLSGIEKIMALKIVVTRDKLRRLFVVTGA